MAATAFAGVNASAVGAAPPQASPTHVQAHETSYVCIRLTPGVTPRRDPRGEWTLGAGNKAGPALLEADRAARLLKSHQVVGIRPLWGHPFRNVASARQHGLDRAWLVDLPAGSDAQRLADELKALPGLVERVELDTIGDIAAVPADSSFPLQWGLHNVGQTGGSVDADVDAPEAWELHQGSASVIVAILDTGVQHLDANVIGSSDHPELAGRVISGWNTRDENADTTDPHGHGTHCAGIAAATGNNGQGVAGINWNAKVLAMRVTNTSGQANQTDTAEAVIYAVEHGAHVISMSLQFYGSENANLRDAVAYAYDSGVLPIAATGNGAGPVVAWPARYEKCMAVGATNHVDARPSFSNHGPQIDLVAPGDGIFGLWRNGAYTTGACAYPACNPPSPQDGTSMAVPHVSGLAALIRSFNSGLSCAQVEAILKATAEDLGPPGFDQEYGTGRINMRKALVEAAQFCPGDTDADNAVSDSDLLAVMIGWGSCAQGAGMCLADVAPTGPGNGVVNVDDLLSVLNGWGGCR